jgi:hypothetical protein
VSVIGRTAARVSTSHLETGSSRPSGGFVVRRTSRQRVMRPGEDDRAATLTLSTLAPR